MIATKALLTIAAVLATSLSVSAAPVQGHEVTPGGVYRAHPVNFEPQHPDNSRHGGGTGHPVVALNHPDHHGMVPVVAASHNHPPHMSDNLHPAEWHDRNSPKRFQEGTHLAIGNPVHVHHDDLHKIGPHSSTPNQLHAHDTQSIQNSVRVHSGVMNQVRRGSISHDQAGFLLDHHAERVKRG